MARDQEPLTDDEIAELRDEMEAQSDEIREFLESEGVDMGNSGSATEARADGGDVN